MKENIIKELTEKSYIIRKNLLKLATKEAIHIGGDLSSTDIMTVLWQYKIKYNIKNPRDENRDRFILSKGHAAALLNFEQALLGCFSEELIFSEYAKDNGRFAMHACNLTNPYVEISTGSLGHGLGVAAGMAMGLKLKGNKKNYVYVLMGDGEQAEGSVWEAAMNAVKYKLGNLVVFIDNNKLSADGTSVDTIGDIGKKYAAFGWKVIEVNGNDIKELVLAVDSLDKPTSSIPTVVIAHTIKGYGVSFMENNLRWHAGKIGMDEYEKATTDIDKLRSSYNG